MKRTVRSTHETKLLVNIEAEDMDLCVLRGTPVIVEMRKHHTAKSVNYQYVASVQLGNGQKQSFDIRRNEVEKF